MSIDPKRIETLKKLSTTIGYTFSDISLLNKALTHRSFANEQQDPKIRDNERFEFLGDSVLDLIVARYVVLTSQSLSEGSLSKIRAQVVNEQSLATIARSLHLGDYLLLGKGELNSGGRDKNSLLANAFEALLAAVFLDSSFDIAYQTFLGILKDDIHERMNGGETDYKGLLLRFLRTQESVVSYQVTKETGPDHEKIFEVRAIVDNEGMGAGCGRSKKEAEQQAAYETYLAMTKKEGEETRIPRVAP